MSLDVGLVAPNVVRRDGQGRVMVELSRALVRAGHRVSVYAHRLDDELAADVRFHAVGRPPGPQLLDDLLLPLRVSRRVRRADHDVTMVMGPCGLPPNPFVYNSQFAHRGWRRTWREGRPGAYHRFHARVVEALSRLVVRRADHVISSTETVGRDTVERMSATFTVVPNGIDSDEFGPVTPEARARARADLGITENRFTIAFLGDYHTPRKGLEPLLRAVASGPEDETLVVASHGDDARLRERASALGITDRLLVAGFAPPADVIAAADAVAVPSLYEPWSLVAMEAAASRVPLVLSSRAGVAGVIGEGAVVVEDPTRPQQLRQAIDAIRRDPMGAARRSRTGRRIVEGLTWEACMSQAVTVIEKVAAEATRHR